MQDLITQKEALRHASAADRCQAVLNAVWARVPEMRAQAPTSISDEQLRAFLIQRVAADKHCQGVTTANVLAANFVLAPVASAFRQTTDTVTDAGIALAQSVADAAAGSSGFPDDVAAATDEVLASASGLSDADLSVGVAEAGIAVSSSSGWYSYGDGGGFAADSAQIYAQSLVMLQWWRVLLNPLTATDALSGAGGMYLAHIAGVDDSYTLWLTGVASAAIGSGAYLAAL